jgi:hypothetical protein
MDSCHQDERKGLVATMKTDYYNQNITNKCNKYWARRHNQDCEM